jgi:TatA/E family protein of Tat protein translocase
MGIDNPVHLIFLAAVALIVLGPKRLPDLARSLGHGMREFRESLNDAAKGDEPGAAQAPPPAQPQLTATVGHESDPDRPPPS